jgi:tRNA (guanine10-N2)-dimethyltransferase
MRIWVELSGENIELARAEAMAVVTTLGGKAVGGSGEVPSAFLSAEWPANSEVGPLVERLALARRVFLELAGPEGAAVERALEDGARSRGGSARLDWFRSPADGSDLLHHLADAYVRGGGSIRMERPDRRFLLVAASRKELHLLEEKAAVDRHQYEGRRMPRLPFQRPVSLAPRLARAAANLAGAGPGQRVADPFVGTGALLLEAGLLGARLFGSDIDVDMVRGAMRNLSAFGLSAEALTVRDAAEASVDLPWPEVDAILTDPPYGRASSTGGEEPTELLRRVLPRWAERVARGGRIVVIGPAGPEALPPPWRKVFSATERVHRSLSREFRVYRRDG